VKNNIIDYQLFAPWRRGEQEFSEWAQSSNNKEPSVKFTLYEARRKQSMFMNFRMVPKIFSNFNETEAAQQFNRNSEID
jgi:hypothetical protein